MLLINNFYFCSQYVPLKIPKCLEFLILLGPEVKALYGNTQPWRIALSRGAKFEGLRERERTLTPYSEMGNTVNKELVKHRFSVEGFKYTYSIYINLLYRISTYWFPCDL